ncbi:uncharacterized protein LOC122328130 [Puntigrus tetrazona]|uniref:uncharacterized protein LOC122328130 n=1 Tax=Puntigrus tetrazona TaxID=1606681 RepID=UPI001C8A8112|nr:uncharacterized protein LOC122328130 [Puntigrus tetrazona]
MPTGDRTLDNDDKPRQKSAHLQTFTAFLKDDKRTGNMVNVSVIFCLWLSRLLDVTDAVKTISVMNGHFVTLKPGVTEVQKYFFIQWMFESTRIAEFNKMRQTSSIYDSPDGRFRDRLKLDHTGSLTITNTRTTDSGLYQLTLGGTETRYQRFNLTVHNSPHTTPSTERWAHFGTLAVDNSTINQTEKNNNTEVHHQSSDKTHCCGHTGCDPIGSLSALVGVATVAVLVYDVRSTKSELNRTEDTRRHLQTLVKSEQQCELSGTIICDYVDMLPCG